MKFHVLTLFPEMIRNITETSIVGRAVKNELISVETINIRDYSANKHMRVDDYPYGGGAGMVMEAEPVYRAIMAAKQDKATRVIYMTPQARVLNQTKVEELALEEELIILCGHYEGIDDRVLQECVTDYVSIGDYVLTGGELGAAVLIDAVSRFIPGVLSNEESSQFESLQDNLLEYPHYTRPELWHDKEVPKVLLSGDHKKIEAWRLEHSKIRTQERRPDLLNQSYQICSLWYGNDATRESAELLTARLSRYGQLYDYNRRKLQKTRTCFQKRQLLIFYLQAEHDTPSERQPARAEGPVYMTLRERYRNLYGQETPYVLIYSSKEEEERMQAETEEFRMHMEKRGFVKLQESIFHPDFSEKEQIRIALQIRANVAEIS